jgi:hypothetical protein
MPTPSGRNLGTDETWTGTLFTFPPTPANGNTARQVTRATHPRIPTLPFIMTRMPLMAGTPAHQLTRTLRPQPPRARSLSNWHPANNTLKKSQRSWVDRLPSSCSHDRVSAQSGFEFQKCKRYFEQPFSELFIGNTGIRTVAY